jgi:hypothetical protein
VRITSRPAGWPRRGWPRWEHRMLRKEPTSTAP